MNETKDPETTPVTPESIEELPSFAELGVPDDIVAALQERGIEAPFPIQALTIPVGLSGVDLCGKAQTGSGKTLAFGIPMVQKTERAKPRMPHSLILVPTRELASQVAENLTPLAKVRNLRVATIYGGVSMQNQIDALRDGVEIVIATPGRLIDHMERRTCDVKHVSMVVLDEADHMADLGFLPQVDRIMRSIPRNTQTLLFSATLDSAVDTLVRRFMHDPVFYEVEAEQATVDQMDHRFIAVHEAEKAKAAAAICSGAERVLIFVRTKRRCDRVATQLSREGVKTEPIHGDLRQSQREKTLAQFSDGKIQALVATNVAARGLHVDGVDLVLHYDSPDDIKTYVHRSGRTARAGEDGLVVTFVATEHLHLAKEMQRMTGDDRQIVTMRYDDERLKDLGSWEPPQVPVKAAPRRGRLNHRTIKGGRRRGRR